MRRIGLVARHTFLELVRDRIMLAVVGFAGLLVTAAVVIAQISAGQDVRIIKNLGLAAIDASGVLMSVLIGVVLVTRDMAGRSVFTVLATPLRRWEFVVGKYLGVVGVVVFNVVIMTAVLIVVLAWYQWMMPAATWAGTTPLDPGLLKAVVLIAAELSVLAAVAVFVSTFASSAPLAALITMGIWVAGQLSADLRAFSAPDAPWLTMFVHVSGAVVPALSDFDVKAQVVNGRPPIGWDLVGAMAAYAVAYIVAVLGGAAAILTRREFP